MQHQSTSDKLSGANATPPPRRPVAIRNGRFTSICDVQSLATSNSRRPFTSASRAASLIYS